MPRDSINGRMAENGRNSGNGRMFIATLTLYEFL